MRNLFMLWSVLATFFSVTSIAQTQTTYCGTDYFLEKEYAENPSLRGRVEQEEEMNFQHYANTETDTVTYIPVVFHVFHDDEIGNISYEQILSAIDMLNEDFRRTNADTSATRAEFKPYAADSKIEFRLAKKDQFGNCTNGVVRKNDAGAAYDADNSVKALSRWPADKYFNIWVVKTIESSGVNGTILGYAQFPRDSQPWNTYGVVIRSDRVGSIGTANFGDRTLTHEVGHCLNLYHTFQSGCGSDCSSSGDDCCDTPPVSQSTQGCNKNLNTCSNDMSGIDSPYTTDVVNQIENYMSYDDCQNMFTLDQKGRMKSILASKTTLIALTSQSNLDDVGVWLDEPAVCSVGFEVESQEVCVGELVQFTDLSYYNPNAYSWSFPGGSPSTSNQSHPIVIYDVPGTYEVSLTISDSNNVSLTEVKSEYITVLTSKGNTTPVQESFETQNDLKDEDWFADEKSNNFKWTQEFEGGSSGMGALKATAYGQRGKINVTSPSYDVRNMDSVNVTFKYAYAPKINEPMNFFRVYISSDCGQSWVLKFVTGSTAMGTTLETNIPYTYPAIGDWVQKSFAVKGSDFDESLRLKFEFRANDGNNLFVDDVNIAGIYIDSTILNYPHNGANDISTSVKLDWYGTSFADYYTVVLDTDPNFSSPNVETHQVMYISGSSSGLDSEYMTSNLVNGVTYYWKVRSTLNGTSNPWSETWNFTPDESVVGVDNVVKTQTVMNVYPNPASDIINIRVGSTESANITISLYDITGSFVQEIYSGMISSGKQNFTMSREGLSNGVYIIRTKTGNGIITKRVILN